MIFQVYGIPEALARPRAVRAGKFVRVYQPKATWQGLVALAAAEQRHGREAFSKAVRLELYFRMPRTAGLPKRQENPHTKKPDLDNLCKSTIDGLVPALLLNDNLVVELHTTKRYALVGESPGCEIRIEDVDIITRGEKE